MPLECVWMGELDSPEMYRHETGPLADGNWQAGWCFFWHSYAPSRLSTRYLDEVRTVRPPIVVLLPLRPKPERTHLHPVIFCIDTFPSSETPDQHWTVGVDLETLVHGARPDITVAPSIDCRGLYHGFLQHGILTDDLG